MFTVNWLQENFSGCFQTRFEVRYSDTVTTCVYTWGTYNCYFYSIVYSLSLAYSSYTEDVILLKYRLCTLSAELTSMFF